MDLSIYPMREAACDIRLINTVLVFCIEKGGTRFEMELYGPPEDVEENERGPELFINPEMLKKAKLIKKGKADPDGKGGEDNMYFLEGEIDKEFIDWFKEHNLMGFGFLEMTLYNKAKERVAYFADTVIGIYNIDQSSTTELKNRLKPFEKNVEYYESNGESK